VHAEVWAIVLAAGAGRRLAGLTGGIPKQFWRPGGRPSLLDGTLARLAPLFARERTVIIVDQAHRSHMPASTCNRAGTLLFQPCDRGTACGALMALLPVLDAGPDAIVLLTAADHGVRDVERFRQGILRVVRRVREHDEVVLFGASAEDATQDYGWIVPGPRGESGLWHVSRFVEKPKSAEAERLLAQGAAWNTMVMAARASRLQALFHEHLGDLADIFESARHLDEHARRGFLSGVYPTIVPRDLSRDLLTQAQNLLVYKWPRGIGWSDLGTPDRLARWLGDPTAPHPVHHAGAA